MWPGVNSIDVWMLVHTPALGYKQQLLMYKASFIRQLAISYAFLAKRKPCSRHKCMYAMWFENTHDRFKRRAGRTPMQRPLCSNTAWWDAWCFKLTLCTSWMELNVSSWKLKQTKLLCTFIRLTWYKQITNMHHRETIICATNLRCQV